MSFRSAPLGVITILLFAFLLLVPPLLVAPALGMETSNLGRATPTDRLGPVGPQRERGALAQELRAEVARDIEGYSAWLNGKLHRTGSGKQDESFAPTEFRISAAGKDTGYIVVSGPPSSPFIYEFSDSGYPVFNHSSNHPRVVQSSGGSTGDADSIATKDISNVPCASVREPDLSAVASTVEFWAGHRMTLLALQRTSLPPFAGEAGMERGSWFVALVKQLAENAGKPLTTARLSTESGEGKRKASFTDYRIEIDRGRPVLLLTYGYDSEAARDGQAMRTQACLGVGYITTRFGNFVCVQIPKQYTGQSAPLTGEGCRRVFINWEVLALDMDIITIAPERGN